MSLELPDTVVAVAGDWHGDAWWAGRAIAAIHRANPQVRTVLQLGDFWSSAAMLDAVDEACRNTGIEQVLVTLGNHERWDVLGPRLAANTIEPIRLSTTVFALPRPYRFTVGRRAILSLGGAASVDQLWRTEGESWWPDERITADMVQQAQRGGAVDILLTHESPENTPVAPVRWILKTNPGGYPDAALHESAESRQRVTAVWDATLAALLMHGHMHEFGEGSTTDGRRVISLGMNRRDGNVVLVDLSSLAATLVRVARF